MMATHNGARTLPEVLKAYCALEPVSGGWKLVIVDNASTDSTRELIHSFKPYLPLTCLAEPEVGKCRALNTGLEHVAGDLVVFTDDDAVPRPDWLRQLRAVADAQPAYSIFGGAIVPRWEVPPEDWLLDWEGPVLTITRPAWEEGPIEPYFVYGPNMAVRADIIRAGHRFDPATGPTGGRYAVGDETDFVERLVNRGLKAWHCKRAVVAHVIRKSQMNKTWLLRRAVAWGRLAYQKEMQNRYQRPAMFLGMPRYMIRQLLTQAARVVGSTLTFNSRAVLRERWTLHYLIGMATAGRELHGKPRTRLNDALHHRSVATPQPVSAGSGLGVTKEDTP